MDRSNIIIFFFSLTLLFSCKEKSPLSTTHYENGNIQGMLIPVSDSKYMAVGIRFFEDGQIQELIYVDKSENAEAIGFSDGGKIQHHGKYLNQKKEGLWKSVSDGKTIAEVIYDNGEIVSQLVFSKSGDTLNSMKDGKAVFYYVGGGLERIICNGESGVLGRIEIDSSGFITQIEGKLPCLTKEDSMKIKFPKSI